MTQQRTSAPWHGAGDYDIGDVASAYVAGVGLEFLQRHTGPGEQTVCDLGCWGGRHLGVLARIAGAVWGVDGPWAKERMRHAQHRHPYACFKEATLGSIPFPDQTFTAGVCWRVIHNLGSLQELRQGVREITRVLRPGAPLLVAVRATRPDMDSHKSMPDHARTSNGFGTREDLYFSLPAVHNVFGKVGLRIEHAELIKEGEVVNDHVLTNEYWAVHLVRQ